MDPKANIDEQVAIAKEIISQFDAGAGDDLDFSSVERLAELVIALHEWRTSGGFDPYVS
jgi:hypothetical protein